MNIQIIGTGAAGNKAAIDALKANIISKDNIMLINSTSSDIPKEYQDRAAYLSDSAFGCAKEKATAERLTVESINNKKLKLNEWVKPTTETVVIVTSSDGGTGCGSTPVIADYIYTEVETKVHLVIFDGFDDDETGLKNTISLYTSLDPNYTYEVICNKKFLKEANNNKLKACELANAEFCKRMAVLSGSCIVESDYNIDQADLLKTTITPGFMNIEYKEFPERLKNIDEFNEFLRRMCDESKTFDISKPSQIRMAVIVNLNKTSSDVIDWSFSVLKERFGQVKEMYHHSQQTKENEFIAFINAGMDIPTDSIDEIYEKYNKLKAQVKREPDAFFKNASKYQIDDDADDDMVYAESTPKIKSKFFSEKKPAIKEPVSGKLTSTNVKVKSVEENY
jgi:cell division GTPase FtsZ